MDTTSVSTKQHIEDSFNHQQQQIVFGKLWMKQISTQLITNRIQLCATPATKAVLERIPIQYVKLHTNPRLFASTFKQFYLKPCQQDDQDAKYPRPSFQIIRKIKPYWRSKHQLGV